MENNGAILFLNGHKPQNQLQSIISMNARAIS